MPRLSLQLSTSPTHAHKSNTFANSFTTLIPVCTNTPPTPPRHPPSHYTQRYLFFNSPHLVLLAYLTKCWILVVQLHFFRGGVGGGVTWAYSDQLCVRAITHMLQDAVNHTAHLLTQYAQGTCSLYTIHTLAASHNFAHTCPPSHPCTQVQRLATITAETQTHTQTQCHNQARGLDNIHPKPLGTLPAGKLTNEYK